MSYVLIVDDAPMIRFMYNHRLSKIHQLPVVEAENGKEALEQIARKMPLVVLTDKDMPVMGGLELITAIRKNHTHLPIVIGSGSWTAEELDKAKMNGANETYEKGVDSTSDVCKRVANYALQH